MDSENSATCIVFGVAWRPPSVSIAPISHNADGFQTASDRPGPRRPVGGTGAINTHPAAAPVRSEEHTSELQSLMRISYAVFCLKKKNRRRTRTSEHTDP